MKESTKDQAKGKFHEVKGKIKEQVGRATGDPDMQNDGQDEKFAGKVRKKVGEAEKVFNR